MNMPNRRAQVYVICEKNPASFPQDDTNDACRRELLLGTIIPSLNRMDDGCWGYMTKTDQGGKVPCDIMMWKDTNEVVDCMTGTGGTWIPHDPPPPEWKWTAVGGTPEPGPTPPVPSIPYDEAKSIQFGQACNAVYDATGAPCDPGMVSVHSQRCAYDYYVLGMPWDECFLKHINEFRAVYGLPPLQA
jgi:hypothetical protein